MNPRSNQSGLMIARLSQGVEFVIPAYAGTTNEKAWKSRRWRDGVAIAQLAGRLKQRLAALIS